MRRSCSIQTLPDAPHASAPFTGTIETTINGAPIDMAQREPQDAAQRPARGRRADRNQGGLRRGRVRRLHGLARRRGGDVLPRPGGAGPRRAAHHHRGPGAAQRKTNCIPSSAPSSSTARRSAATASPACSWPAPSCSTSDPIPISPRRRSRSAATSAAAPATARSSTPSSAREASHDQSHPASIGASEPRPDALGKVTGAARYPADLVRPDMLRLKVVFAERPHARIRSLDTAAALAHPGVVAVLTAATFRITPSA